MILILALIYVILLIGCNYAADSIIRRRSPPPPQRQRSERVQADQDDIVAYMEAIGFQAHALRKRAEHTRDDIKRARLYSQSARLTMQASKIANELRAAGADALLYDPDNDTYDCQDVDAQNTADQPIKLKQPYTPHARRDWCAIARRVIYYICCIDGN